MELDIALLKKDMDYLKSKVENIETLLTHHIKDENTKFDKIMEEKADKHEVEKIWDIIRWVSYLIIGTVVLALIGTVIAGSVK